MKFLNRRMLVERNACNDFYGFSCGKFSASQNLPLLAPFDIMQLDLKQWITFFFDNILKLPDPHGMYKTMNNLFFKCLNLGKCLFSIVRLYAKNIRHDENVILFYQEMAIRRSKI